MTINIKAHVGRGTCNHYVGKTNNRQCIQKRNNRAEIHICHNCPRWSQADALYEEVTGRHVNATYDWWREEWIRGHNGLAIEYAFERMLDHVTERPWPTPMVQAPRLQHVSQAQFDTEVFVRLVVSFLALVIGTIILILMLLYAH